MRGAKYSYFRIHKVLKFHNDLTVKSQQTYDTAQSARDAAVQMKRATGSRIDYLVVDSRHGRIVARV